MVCRTGEAQNSLLVIFYVFCNNILHMAAICLCKFNHSMCLRWFFNRLLCIKLNDSFNKTSNESVWVNYSTRAFKLFLFTIIRALMSAYVLHTVEREWFLAEAFVMFYWWRCLYCKGRDRKTCTLCSGDVIAQYIKMYDTRELVGWLSMWREQKWINIETSLWNINTNTNNESNWGI